MAARMYEDPDAMVAEVLRLWPCTIAVFIRYRMLCVGCYVSPFHSISDACLEHDVDAKQFIRDLASVVTAVPPR